MTKYEERIIQLFLNNPDCFLPLLKQEKHVNRAYSVLKKFFPEPFGIEFETGYKDTIRLNVKGLSQSYAEGEQKIKVDSFKDVVNLNLLLKYFREFVPFNISSGIHIHVNVGEISHHMIRSRVSNDVKLLNDDILRELVELTNYEGTFNRLGFSYGGHTTARLSMRYNTIEYRIFHMTYDIKQLLKWVMMAQYLSARVRAAANSNKPQLCTDQVIQVLVKLNNM